MCRLERETPGSCRSGGVTARWTNGNQSLRHWERNSAIQQFQQRNSVPAPTTSTRAVLDVDGHFVVLSGGWSEQTGSIRGAPVNDWRGGPMFQHEASDVVLAGKPHALLAPGIFQKTIEHA